MQNTYLLRLGSNDLGQIIDGLRAREEAWRITADYFRTGVIECDSLAIEECNGEQEAAEIARFYSRIIRNLERQREKQRDGSYSLESEAYLQGKADGQDNLIIRILNNWPHLRAMNGTNLRRGLEELKDEICDE